jgi:hypothetical protein
VVVALLVTKKARKSGAFAGGELSQPGNDDRLRSTRARYFLSQAGRTVSPPEGRRPIDEEGGD